LTYLLPEPRANVVPAAVAGHNVHTPRRWFLAKLQQIGIDTVAPHLYVMKTTVLIELHDYIW